MEQYVEPMKLYLQINNKYALISYETRLCHGHEKVHFHAQPQDFSLRNENVFLYKGYLCTEIQNFSLANYVGPPGLTS